MKNKTTHCTKYRIKYRDIRISSITARMFAGGGELRLQPGGGPLHGLDPGSQQLHGQQLHPATPRAGVGRALHRQPEVSR